MELGLYIHIPFCRQKCNYCDFSSYAGMEQLYGSYTEALRRDIAGQGLLFSQAFVDTVYLGGGTPSVLPAKLLINIIKEIKNSFCLTDSVEFSMEANPGTIDEETLAVLRQAGINRVSFGIQSFSDSHLASLGRIHNSSQGIEAVRLARQAGFSNISVDLMYDLPNQTWEDWKYSLECAADLDVNHISAYGLKIEPNTPFADCLESGELTLPDDEVQNEMYELVNSYLPLRGYDRYEISNYAKDGFACRHNLKYWRFLPYLGLGAAAHSFWDGERFANTDNINEYINCMRRGESAVHYRARISQSEAMAEYCFLNLRTTEGISLENFHNHFGISFEEIYGHQTTKLSDRGLVVVSGGWVKLTPVGMKYGNQVFCDFLP